jgi:uncharacterized membrane protein YfcA
MTPASGLLLGAAAFIAATLAAVTGFGGAAVLLPVLALTLGVREAIPVLTVAQLIGNGSRVWFNRRELDLRVVGWYTVGALPFALVGGYLFAHAPLSILTRTLGVFLLGIVIWRRLRPKATWRPPLRSFVAIGAGASVVSALVGSVGPLMAPLFLAYGLVKGAYIGTEALATVITHVGKLVAYGQTSTLSPYGALVGVALGPVMIVGSLLGKRIVDRLPESVFVIVIEVTMVCAGLLFALKG